MKKLRITGGWSGFFVALVGFVSFIDKGFTFTVLFLWIGAAIMIGRSLKRILDDYNASLKEHSFYEDI